MQTHQHCPHCGQVTNLTPGRPLRTHLNVVLDRSGSMMAVRDQTIAGYNEWLQTQKNLKDDNAVLTLTLFNDPLAIETRYTALPLSEVPLLTAESYRPDGNTALNDAIVRTIRAMEYRVGPGERVLTVILTDGYENASREYRDPAMVRGILKAKEALGNWTFTFLMAGLDKQAQAVGMTYGLHVNNVRAYNPENIHGTFTAVGAATASYRASTAMNSVDVLGAMSRDDEEDSAKKAK